MATGKLRVGVIFGGRSGEHEVSLVSASTVIESLDRDKYEVVPIGIAKTGTWILSGDPMRILRSGQNAGDVGQTLPSFDEATMGGPIDVVIPMVHGTFGEDGTLQGLLEMAQVAYVGAGVLASAAGMDKAIMKDLFRQHGIPVVESLAVLRQEWRDDEQAVRSRIAAELGYPCFVKPANLGSSVGISKAHDSSELAASMDEAAAYDRKIVVERAVEGCREIEVAVLGNDNPVASAPGEIVPCHEFYDYAAKYVDEGSQLLIPAPLEPDQATQVRRLAVEAFKAVDCSGMARVDSFLSRADGHLYVNEVNTIPGFTAISMYPKLWAHSGLSIGALLDRLIDLALERHAEKRSFRTSYSQ